MILRYFLLIVVLFFISLSTSHAFTHEVWTSELYDHILKHHGKKAEQRARLLQKIIKSEKNKPVEEELRTVNDFFNQVKWVSDILHWGKKDYWQTPMQTLIEFKGDCEDIALAKYTTLRVLGYTEEQLRMLYVISKQGPHMVLLFYKTPRSTPLILDSLISKITTPDKRKDLRAIYEFNSKQEWVTNKKLNRHREVLHSHLKLRDSLEIRIKANRLHLQSHNNGIPVVPFDLSNL